MTVKETQVEPKSSPLPLPLPTHHPLAATNPLRLVINNASPSQPPPTPPRSTLTQQQSLSPTSYTNKISLFLFIAHLVLATGLLGFLAFKGIHGLIEEGRVQREEKTAFKCFLPQVVAASFLSIALALIWQKAFTLRSKFMPHFIIWTCFAFTLSAGILLICFQIPATKAIGVLLILFSVGNSLYACWVTQRTSFCSRVFTNALVPVSRFPGLHHPVYWMLGLGFLWTSFWTVGLLGVLNFKVRPLFIILLVLSSAWTTEVMRNVANLTVCRPIALYYMRGIQSNPRFCFQRALSKNLGSACLGSLFVPTIEALRIIARILNLLQGEDEFMFSCARCCLCTMESVFQRGNGWAYVQIAAYGKGFVKASQDTWELFEKRGMVEVVDSDITSAVCFLAGVCSGSICTIMVAAWTSTVHHGYITTLSILAMFVGYLMTRISMALHQACVSCYYVCYAENPDNRLFDTTIPDHMELIKSSRDTAVSTPRVPHGVQ